MKKRKKFTLLFISILFFLTLITILFTFFTEKVPVIKGNLTISVTTDKKEFILKGYRIVLENEKRGGILRIFSADAPAAPIFENLPGLAFIGAAQGEADIEEKRSHFKIRERLKEIYSRQIINSIYQENERLTIEGVVQNKKKQIPYSLTFYTGHNGHLSFRLTAEQGNRLFLTFTTDKQEAFWGFGEQFSYFNLKGKRIPVIISEQGIGRGLQPLTMFVNILAGAGGHWYSSYSCVPQFITDRNRGFYLKNYEASIFDLRKERTVQISILSSTMEGALFAGSNTLDLISSYTRYSGRMRKLPDWIHEGAIIGMQGGTEKIIKIHDQLKALNTPVTGFWLQDWVGHRITDFGKQLWWNWELDEERYPGWKDLIQNWNQENIKVLLYVNPWITDTSGRTNQKRDLFKEALDRGFVITDAVGKPYTIKNTSFSSHLLDLSNPGARDWIKDIITKQMIGIGASGWMSDYAEAMPFDSRVSTGETGETYHNRYAEEWARVNREAVEEYGKNSEEFVFFSRSAFTRSPAYSPLFFLGDQLVSWDRHDGIKSAITGMLSSGISGFSMNHSDIGGYTTLSSPVLNYHRSRELLYRWMEMNAFSLIFRTHEGNQPEKNHQFYTDQESMELFSRMAKVFKAWFFYRKQLVDEATEKGWPVLRHPVLYYPEDPVIHTYSWEAYMIGSEFYVAPVLEKGQLKKKVYLPEGDWVHLWSGEAWNANEKGIHVTVDTPYGKPPVFYKKGSEVAAKFIQNLKSFNVF